MSERKREHIYWMISLFFLLLSPLLIYLLLRTDLKFAFPLPFFTIFMVLSIPFSVLMEIIFGLVTGTGVGRFNVVNPSISGEFRIEEDYSEYLQKVRERLARLGFLEASFEEVEDIMTLAFRKTKTPMCNAFLDHAFAGQLSLRPDQFGVDVRLALTFKDTLLMETGEAAQLRALGDYLLLRTADFTYENVPLTLYCGLNLAFFTAILSLVNYVVAGAVNGLLFTMAAGAAGMIVIMALLMLRDREHLFGYRLAWAGLYLAALPYACLVIRMSLAE